MQNLATEVTVMENTLVMIKNYHTVVLRTVLFLLFSLLLVTQVSAGPAEDTARAQAKRIHDRLAGVAPSIKVLDTMEAQVLNGDFIDAAYEAMKNKHFYNATLVNLITPWTNEAQAVFPEDMGSEGILNDYTATVIGVIRDDLDFRTILYGDILYVATGPSVTPAVPAYSFTNNAHYKEVEKRGLDLSDTDVLVNTSQSSIPGNVLETGDTAGVLTSRAGAKAFFVDGTNRAMFRFTVLNHLCQDMEQLKDVTLPSDRIRQDVSRSPGGDSRIFMNECIGCHTGMDPLTQAFAYYDYDYPNDDDGDGVDEYEKGELVFNKFGSVDVDRLKAAIPDATRVQAKNLINEGNFKTGYIVTDDAWTNFWRQGKNNKLLGWDAALPGEGTGAKSMAQELAHSRAFATCQVQKVFKAVCLRPAGNNDDRVEVNRITDVFVAGGHKLKQVFAETAAYCKGP